MTEEKKKKKKKSSSSSSKKRNFSQEIKTAVDGLWKLQEKYTNKTSLFGNGDFVFLQVALFKVPQVEDEFVKRKILLEHSPWEGTPEVCLFVRDFIQKNTIKRTSDELIDATIEKYEQLLRKHKVTGITTIMPLKQFRSEYKTYELKRKLVDHFDVFLCGSTLLENSNFLDSLGSGFIKKCKCPIPVKLPKFKDDYDPRLNSRIQAAISSTVYHIKRSSDNYSIRVGNMVQAKDKLIENLTNVIEKIVESDYLVPGGFANVRLMSIKCQRSKSVPIYINFASGNEVPVPYVPSNAPVREDVEDELTTQPGKRVTVLPSGEIVLKKEEKSEKGDEEVNENDDEPEDEDEEEDVDMDEGDDDEEGDVDDEEDEIVFKPKKGKQNETAGDAEDVSDDEDADGEIERAEQNYLSNLNDESEEEEEEEEEVEQGKKKGAKRKRRAPGDAFVEAKKPKRGVKAKKWGDVKKEKILKSKKSKLVKKPKTKKMTK